ncbi:hypothetical protein BDV29DRAFT_175721 [Aspergillus leporis]|uniref:Uncharacterized protein n=1 Tax=Aspergillus leporis TaxID=41062 RepID=A0A5N5WXV4_9EURO|nr:hypothetical protein BDV29DRAFT_175721 [Aspergillus leporis]
MISGDYTSLPLLRQYSAWSGVVRGGDTTQGYNQIEDELGLEYGFQGYRSCYC